MVNRSKYKSLLIKAFYVLKVSRTCNYNKTRSVFKTLLEKEEWLSNEDRALLFKNFINLYKWVSRSDIILGDDIIAKEISIMNHLEVKYSGVEKRHGLESMVDACRDQTFPSIFYLASHHNSTSSGNHGQYQGKIYVDERWREVMNQHHELGWLVYPIESYIKGHNIKTIQWVTGLNGDKDSPYMMLRPYCRHYFIPLSTWDVLTSSLKAIKRDNLSARMTNIKRKSSKQYKLEHKKLVQNLKNILKD